MQVKLTICNVNVFTPLTQHYVVLLPFFLSQGGPLQNWRGLLHYKRTEADLEWLSKEFDSSWNSEWERIVATDWRNCHTALLENCSADDDLSIEFDSSWVWNGNSYWRLHWGTKSFHQQLERDCRTACISHPAGKLHSNALHCIVLNCIAMHCIALHCISGKLHALHILLENCFTRSWSCRQRLATGKLPVN